MAPEKKSGRLPTAAQSTSVNLSAAEDTTLGGDVVVTDDIREIRRIAYRLLILAELSEELVDDGPRVAA